MPRPTPRRAGAALLVWSVLALVGGACASTGPDAAAPTTTPVTATSPTDDPGPAGTDPGTTVDESVGDDRPVAPIAWEACGTGRECATYPVPADHDDPDGPTVPLALIRRPATGTDRIGTLFVNPGGPGASGVDFVRLDRIDATLNQYFDIASWDPRGVGSSKPVDCDDEVEAMRRTDWDPDDATEQAELDDAAEAIADDCAERYGDWLTRVDTDSTVRDLDLLRRAVGDDQLSYLGFSYGTAIGLRYAELFPERVRAIVLDGVVDPTQDLEELLTGQAVAFEHVVDERFSACAATPACPLADPADAYERVKAKVEAQPLTVPGEDPVGPTDLAYAAIATSYQDGPGTTLVAALAAAEQGDGRPLRQLADRYFASAAYSQYAAVVCTDNPHPDGASDYEAMTERMAEAAPRFGAAVASEMAPCAFWSAPVTGRPGPVTAAGAAPILVVGNTGDSATPFSSAERVADDLESGVLLTYHGSGHTSFASDDCVQAVVRSYLVDLVTPDAGTECPTPR